MLNYQRVYCIILFYPRKQWSTLQKKCRFVDSHLLKCWFHQPKDHLQGEKLWRFLWSLGWFKGNITGNPGNLMVKKTWVSSFQIFPNKPIQLDVRLQHGDINQKLRIYQDQAQICLNSDILIRETNQMVMKIRIWFFSTTTTTTTTTNDLGS